MTRAAFFLLLSAMSSAGCASAWQPVCGAPEPKVAPLGAVVDNSFYLMGGFVAKHPSSSSYRLDLIQNRWSRIADLPLEAGIEDAGVTALDGKVYVVGGTTRGGLTSQETFVYDPILDFWAESVSLKLPEWISGARIAPYQDGILLIGGKDAHGVSSKLYWADPKSGRGWTELPVSLKRPQKAPVVAADSTGRVWVAGTCGAGTGSIQAIEPDLKVSERAGGCAAGYAYGFAVGPSFYAIGADRRFGAQFLGDCQAVPHIGGFQNPAEDAAYAGNDYWLVKSCGVSASGPSAETEVFYVAPAPIAKPDEYAVAGGRLSVPGPGLLANDVSAKGDCQAILRDRAQHGSVELYPDGSFEYTAEAGFKGMDSFTYVAVSRAGSSQVCTVTLHVK